MPQNQQECSQQMRREHTNFLKLEADRFESADCMALWNNIIILLSVPIRTMFEMYRRDRYDPKSTSGKKLMCGLLMTMDSNRTVEDIHQPLRLDTGANQNRRLSKDHVQDVVEHSGVLEARGVPHRSRVTKVPWLKESSHVLRTTCDDAMHPPSGGVFYDGVWPCLRPLQVFVLIGGGGRPCSSRKVYVYVYVYIYVTRGCGTDLPCKIE